MITVGNSAIQTFKWPEFETCSTEIVTAIGNTYVSFLARGQQFVKKGVHDRSQGRKSLLIKKALVIARSWTEADIELNV